MPWGDPDIYAYQMGTPAFADQMVSNHDYLGGAGSGAADASTNGRIGLSILSLTIIGLMAFYVLTRTRQY
jgi:hypothetical protein